MNIIEAQQFVEKSFPFENYMENELVTSKNVAQTVQKYLKEGDHVLDFASGPCDKTAVLQKLGFQCSAYDDLSDDWHLEAGNREKIIDFADSMGIEFHLANDSTMPFRQNTFDMVMAHDVLEHLHNSPRVLLNDLVSFLRPGGYLFITVPNAVNIRKRFNVLRGRTNMPNYREFYWYPDPWRGHVREYVKDDLRQLSEYLGLNTRELTSCHHMLEVVPHALRPIYKAVTKIFPGWRDSWLLVAQKPENWSAATELPEKEFAELIGKHSVYYESKK